MQSNETTITTKLKWNLPWLIRYPASRLGSMLEQTLFEKKHVIFTIADHFEPSWSSSGLLGHDDQMRRLEAYHKLARATGEAVIDSDGTKYRHTNYYPAEQYHPDILDVMSAMQAEGLGEVEIHLHHGVEAPDNSDNLRRVLTEFRDTLAERHRCLSRWEGVGDPMYAFVHGNLALGNSCGGRFCGVDDEMQILQETGCYADMTLPSAPDQSQVAMINAIYECGNPLNEPVAHRSGKRVSAGGSVPQLPLIVTGPLVFNWTRTIKGIPFPRIDDGALTANQPADIARLHRWLNANITVAGRTDWIFVKLYCHGFFDHDMSTSIGEGAKAYFNDIIEYGQGAGNFDVHFASARETFNMISAAIEGRRGSPGDYRDHRLKAIMSDVRS